MKKIRIRAGMRLPFKCSHCGYKVEGVVYRERIRWYCKLACGHRKYLGLVLPIEELERRGYANYQEEKKYITPKEQMIMDGEIEQKELQTFVERKKDFTRSRYL